MKRAVERARLQQEPHLLWNAFIDLLAMEDYVDLSSMQRQAHLVFWYDSEVQNGGHGQFFENRGVDTLAETVEALREFGLQCQAQILSRAVGAFSGKVPDVDSAERLVDSFIDALDDEFDGCTPTIVEVLEQHLVLHRGEYVEVI